MPASSEGYHLSLWQHFCYSQRQLEGKIFLKSRIQTNLHNINNMASIQHRAGTVKWGTLTAKRSFLDVKHRRMSCNCVEPGRETVRFWDFYCVLSDTYDEGTETHHHESELSFLGSVEQGLLLSLEIEKRTHFIINHGRFVDDFVKEKSDLLPVRSCHLELLSDWRYVDLIFETKLQLYMYCMYASCKTKVTIWEWITNTNRGEFSLGELNYV